MKLVIEISEDIFFDLKKKQNRTEVDNAILNGTPLPKGHGDLIDRKELLKQPMDNVFYPSNYVRIAPPIIEEDKEGVESHECNTCKFGKNYTNGYDVTTMNDECGGCCSWNDKWQPKEGNIE